MGENAQEMLQGKSYQQYFENAKIKLNYLTDLYNNSSKTAYTQDWKETFYLILET